MDKYQQSVCVEETGILHNYQKLYETKHGIVEQCINRSCGDKQFFPWDVPNAEYLSFHIRSALQKWDAVFSVNYPYFNQ